MISDLPDLLHNVETSLSADDKSGKSGYLRTEKLEWLSYHVVKKSLFVLAQLTNVTDRRTDRQTDRHRVPAIAAFMHSIAR